MTARTWVGGHSGNNADDPQNWTPIGAPQPGDTLTAVSGTMEIGRDSLAGNVLHLDDQDRGQPITLDLRGNGASVSIAGQREPGDTLNVTATGKDFLDASQGFLVNGGQDGGNIDLANNAHLYVTGTMSFGYGGSITGGGAAMLTNYGRINLGSSNGPNLSPGMDGTVSALVNGDGTLAFRGYHNGPGYAEISSPITMAQRVELDPGSSGMNLTLSDPADFHAMLHISPVIGRGDCSVTIKGIHAEQFVPIPDQRIVLFSGPTPVYVLRIDNAASFSITDDAAADTTLTFHSLG
jgi:hypothetical protein